MIIQTIEMDTDKVYSIIVEVGDMPKDAVVECLNKVKSLYEGFGIKAVYSAMNSGIPFITVNEMSPEGSII